MATINLYKAKTHLCELIRRAAAGEEIIIAYRGKPVARLVPMQSQKGRRELGMFQGKFQVPQDFDAPLPEEILRAFEGKSRRP